MGWRVRPWNGHFQINHSGSQPETRTYLLVFPTENFAAAMASNLERLDLMPCARRLASAYIWTGKAKIIDSICKERKENEKRNRRSLPE